jgi:beta-galactosidase
MKFGTGLALASLFLWVNLVLSAEPVTPRERLLLDFGWKFHLGNDWGTGEDLAKAGSSSGPAQRDFPDAGWRNVRLPHDWAIELPFDEHSDGSHGFKPIGPGFTQNSVGWRHKPSTSGSSSVLARTHWPSPSRTTKARAD